MSYITIIVYNNVDQLKTGYIEYFWKEYYANAIQSAIVNRRVNISLIANAIRREFYIA